MAAVTYEFPAQQVSDAAIIRESCRLPERFAGIFDRYYGQVHDYAARRLGQHLADDVAAETFLIAFTLRGRYDLSRANARPWLFGITSNLISRHHRSEARRYTAMARARVSEVDAGHAEQVDARIDAESQRTCLASALARIREADRDVLLLIAWAGLTSAEAGEALRIPAGTARSRLHRARNQIRGALTPCRSIIGEDN
ncbi:MAG: RNA polymerase sigma factor [Nocardiopsaceae bacterium]|jgi:RNA polymerase sigma-70 factor (ECF subfamily)|nr:RNA polymerase sigma factor [Nocardiopsaceae bacterium]